MTECTQSSFKFEAHFRRAVVADFQGGAMTSDAGRQRTHDTQRPDAAEFPRTGLREILAPPSTERACFVKLTRRGLPTSGITTKAKLDCFQLFLHLGLLANEQLETLDGIRDQLANISLAYLPVIPEHRLEARERLVHMLEPLS